MAQDVEPSAPQNISITPLLRRLWPSPGENNVTAEEVALAISHIFTDQLSPVQTGALLTCLHFTGWDRRADVIAKCAEAMREAASHVDRDELARVVKARGRSEGDYQGGLVSYVTSSSNPYILKLGSATLWVLEGIRITLSTSLPHHPSWLLLFFS
jgi:anthranilate phosphoribosyltransferase